MNNNNKTDGITPVSVYFNLLAKRYIGAVTEKLSHLEIDRYFAVLLIIDNYGNNITQQNLADYFKIDKASLVRIIDYLSKNGLLERKVNTNDRREYFLTLTPKAMAIMPEIREAHTEMNDIALKGMSPEQIKAFYDSLHIICKNLSAVPAQEFFIKYQKVKNKK